MADGRFKPPGILLRETAKFIEEIEDWYGSDEELLIFLINNVLNSIASLNAGMVRADFDSTLKKSDELNASSTIKAAHELKCDCLLLNMSLLKLELRRKTSKDV